MISDDRQLQQALDQMARMCGALSALRADVLPRNRQQFAMMAEGPLEELRRLEGQVSLYVERTLSTPGETPVAQAERPA